MREVFLLFRDNKFKNAQNFSKKGDFNNYRRNTDEPFFCNK